MNRLKTMIRNVAEALRVKRDVDRVASLMGVKFTLDPEKIARIHAEDARTAPADKTSVEIPGLPGRWRQITARYDYVNKKLTCPHCGGVGWVWHGWFTCDSVLGCGCVAIVADGRAFVPHVTTDKQK